MAAPVYRASISGGGTAGTGDRTITFTPNVGDLAVVFYSVSDCTDAAPSCTDNQGGTYTLIATAIWGATSQNRLYCWVCDRLQPAAVNTTITVDTTSNSAGEFALLAMANFGKVGANAVRSFGVLDNGAAASTPAVSLNQAALTRNPTAVALASADSSTTPPTNWTERQENSQATPTTVIEVSTRDSGFTGTTITFPATCDTTHAAIAIELDGDIPISGATAGSCTVAGTLQSLAAAAGSAAGSCTVAGTLTATASLAGAAAGSAAVSGVLVGSGALAGACAGSCTADASLTASGALVGAAEGSSDASAALAGVGALVGSVAGSSTCEGSLDAFAFLSGEAFGTCTASATLIGIAPDDTGILEPAELTTITDDDVLLTTDNNAPIMITTTTED